VVIAPECLIIVLASFFLSLYTHSVDWAKNNKAAFGPAMTPHGLPHPKGNKSSRKYDVMKQH
jgi:hypothetical protein